MTEMRLIDWNRIFKEVEESLQENPHTTKEQRDMHNHEHNHFLCMLMEQPIIDPEDLPIVQELREQLAKVTNQRNELFELLNDICKDVRETHVDDSVCGLCEYDGAYIGESGDWANECPGFDIDDCFCMKKSIKQEYGQKEVLEDEEKSALR